MCVGYFDSRQNHIYPFDGKLRATFLLVFKPLAERFDLLLRVRREQMLDRPRGGGDKEQFCIRHSNEGVLAVVVAGTCESDAPRKHRFVKRITVILFTSAPPQLPRLL